MCRLLHPYVHLHDVDHAPEPQADTLEQGDARSLLCVVRPFNGGTTASLDTEDSPDDPSL